MYCPCVAWGVDLAPLFALPILAIFVGGIALSRRGTLVRYRAGAVVVLIVFVWLAYCAAIL